MAGHLPSVPAERDWEVSLGDLVPEIRRVPSFLAGLLRSMLRRFGHLGLSTNDLMINGQRLSWSRIVEIRVRDTEAVVMGMVSDLFVDRLSMLLPWFIPKRRKLTQLLIDCVLAIASHLAVLAGSRNTRVPPLIPYEIIYDAGLGRHQRHTMGVFAVLVLGVVPDVNASFVATAAQHRVPARVEPSGEPTPPGLLSQRLHERVAALHQKVVAGTVPRWRAGLVFTAGHPIHNRPPASR
ncbi:MAG: hypothetical protein ACT4NY_26760 [Pseudonocardiales bacterium]